MGRSSRGHAACSVAAARAVPLLTSPSYMALDALPACLQSNLRKQFYGDLVELRGALLNTMTLEPQRSGNLHLKLQLIDSALQMLEVGSLLACGCWGVRGQRAFAAQLMVWKQ